MSETMFVQQKGAIAMGINVFRTPRERHGELIDTLEAISTEVKRHGLKKSMGAVYHRALDAPIVINYVRYTHKSGGDDLRNLDVTKPLMKRTHDLSDGHEFRWYHMTEVVTADGAPDSFEIAAGHEDIGVIGVYVVEPDTRSALLDALNHYAESLKGVEGFRAMAVLRGHKPEHAASYELWANEAAYHRANANGARKALERVRGMASDALIHPYELVRVHRHKGAA